MRTGRVIKEYKGGYGRIGQIWITYTKCTICGQENICICSDGSEEEYCGANICYWNVELVKVFFSQGINM